MRNGIPYLPIDYNDPYAIWNPYRNGGVHSGMITNPRPQAGAGIGRRRRAQAGDGFWDDVDGFLKDTKILSTLAGAAAGLVGEAVAAPLGPVAPFAGAALGYGVQQLVSQTGYRDAPRKKRSPVKKRKAPKRK